MSGATSVRAPIADRLSTITNSSVGDGVLRYVRVEYSGREITTDNELNSFTFNAVADTRAWQEAIVDGAAGVM